VSSLDGKRNGAGITFPDSPATNHSSLLTSGYGLGRGIAVGRAPGEQESALATQSLRTMERTTHLRCIGREHPLELTRLSSLTISAKPGLSWGGVSAVDCENATKSELRQCPDSTDEKIAAPHAREV
jgi:hypothetical protein